MVRIAQRLEEQQAELEALRQRQDSGAEERTNEMESRLEVCESVSDVYTDALSDMKDHTHMCNFPFLNTATTITTYLRLTQPTMFPLRSEMKSKDNY